MLKMRMLVPFLLLICSVVAKKESSSPNHVDTVDTIEDKSSEGRCGGCGSHTIEKPTHDKPDIHELLHSHDLWAIIISSLGSFGVLAFNILAIVLLVLLLKSIFSDDSGPELAYAADPYSHSAPSSYADPFTYTKRSLRSFSQSPYFSTLTDIVSDALQKYNRIDNK